MSESETLPERLRHHAEIQASDQSKRQPTHLVQTLRDAADELARLTGEVARLETARARYESDLIASVGEREEEIGKRIAAEAEVARVTQERDQSLSDYAAIVDHALTFAIKQNGLDDRANTVRASFREGVRLMRVALESSREPRIGRTEPR